MVSVFKNISGLSILLICSYPAFAKDPSLADMLKDVEYRQSVPEIKVEAIQLGKERALLCSQCHGEDGNSKKDDVPNLAQQNPSYLLQQIEKFANGTRKNYVMNVLAKNFTSEDKVNLSLYYASMNLKVIQTDPLLAKAGKSLYLQKCSACHGKKGAGEKNFARIAGQQVTYVTNTLKRFRNNARNKNSGSESKRSSEIMESVTKPLTDKNIESLAAYLAQLR